MWTGESDLNAIRVDGIIFESEKIKKMSEYVWTGP